VPDRSIQYGVGLSPGAERGDGVDAESLKLSGDVFRTVFESAGIGMALVGLDGYPVATNHALQDMLGYSEAELRSRTFGEITHPADRGESDRESRALLRGRIRRYQLQKRYLRKDGESVLVRLTVTLVRRPDGSPLWGVGMVEDITELHRAAEERKQLRARLAIAQEEERRRLAEDLHDDPVQKLTALGLRLDMFARELSADQRGSIQQIQMGLADAIQRLRWLMFDLRPPALDSSGLVEALRELLTRFQSETEWHIDFSETLSCDPPEAIASAVYRVAREALTNARKHASATKVSIRLHSDLTKIWGRVHDNGIGFDVPATSRSTHLGLASMTERAELFEGTCRIDSRSGAGTTVRFSFPLPPVAGATTSHAR
jgi:PAS domain S-box-containing protein